MSNFYYSLIGILAIFIQLIVNYRYYLEKNFSREMKNYRRFLNSVFLYLLTDISWGFLYKSDYTTLLYIDTIAFFLLTSLSMLIFCRYVISLLNIKKFFARILNSFGIFFVGFVLVTLVVNHFTHIFFWYGDAGNYKVMTLRHLTLMLQILFAGFIALVSLIVGLRRDAEQRNRNISICLFCLSMMITLALQMAFPLLPLYSIGLLLGTLVINIFIHKEELDMRLGQIEMLNRKLSHEHEDLLKQRDEISTSYAIIEGLSHDYRSIWWANKEDMKLHIVRTSGTVNMHAVQTALEDVESDIAIRHYIENYVVDEDKERIARQVNVKKVLEQLSKSDFYAVNYMRKREDGRQDYNQMAFANAETADGKHLLVFGFRDVNDILNQERLLKRERALRKEITEAKVAAEIESEMKTKFLQNMSHEIRTPLNAMFGFAQLLGLPDGSCTEEEKTQYNSYIYNSYRMLEMLISDIIDIADFEHGNYMVEISDVNVNNVCRNAVMSVEFRVPATVKLYMTSDFNDDFVIRSDDRRIQQVLINYLTNACKNTQKGEIHLHVSSSEHPGRVTFSVTDTGCGVPADKASEVFNRFTKLNKFVQGSGLGLSICQTIAEKLGGDVYLDTEYKGGARFVFVVGDREESVTGS